MSKQLYFAGISIGFLYYSVHLLSGGFKTDSFLFLIASVVAWLISCLKQGD